MLFMANALFLFVVTFTPALLPIISAAYTSTLASQMTNEFILYYPSLTLGNIDNYVLMKDKGNKDVFCCLFEKEKCINKQQCDICNCNILTYIALIDTHIDPKALID